MESSPLRLRSNTDDDHDDLIARVPAMPTAPDMCTVDQLEITEVVSSLAEAKEHHDDEDSMVPAVEHEDDSNPCGVVLERCVMKFHTILRCTPEVEKVSYPGKVVPKHHFEFHYSQKDSKNNGKI